jgi:hypothetical protein
MVVEPELEAADEAVVVGVESVITVALLTKERFALCVSTSKFVPSDATTVMNAVAPPPELDASPMVAKRRGRRRSIRERLRFADGDGVRRRLRGRPVAPIRERRD